MKEAPKEFDVMPAHELHKALRADLPDDATLAWRHVGNLKVTGARLTVIDPEFYRPGHVLDEGRILYWPHEVAEIWLLLIARPSGDVLRVRAVLVKCAMSSTDKITKAKVEIGSSAVDSAQMMVADTRRLRTCWNTGGSKNVSVLGRSENTAKLKKEKRRAAAFLAEHGYLLTRREDDYLSYDFDKPLTEAEIGRANKLLKDAGIKEDVNVILPHSVAIIHQTLKNSFVASLDDGDSPYSYTFPSGWGDGIYWWDAFTQGDRLVAYACDFMEDTGGDAAYHLCGPRRSGTP